MADNSKMDRNLALEAVRVTAAGRRRLLRVVVDGDHSVSLDETAERVMRERIDAVNSATGLLADRVSRDRWLDTLAVLARGDDPPGPPRVGMAPRCPPVISGRLTRLLLDAGRLSPDGAAARMSRELSAGAAAGTAMGKFGSRAPPGWLFPSEE